MTQLILSGKKAYWVVMTLLAASGLCLSLLLSTQAIEVPPLADYHLYRCDTGEGERAGAASNAPVYRILLVSSTGARAIADRLCSEPGIQQHYRGIEVSWRPRGQLSAEQILSEDYDLIWSRDHTMAGVVPEYGDYYEPLLRYDHYRVYWFSRGAPPEVSREYFHGKRIGLLNDKQSHTLYLLPLASLKEAGIDFTSENLIYFDDAASLYRAFARDELDLVSGGDYLDEDMDVSFSRTLISGDVTAATLFVRKTRVTGVDCLVAEAFDSFAVKYLRSQRVFREVSHCAS
ncbi:hypothetical protein [uncultured Microbulbifer sp.]|uniref:hypothetical protein n=1 Tax=uncultured Microbulbifer sp. TaxID=348147 RepID=UPI002622AB69|nr:hypothetical protein [uncultured Microbulbifer sp.]